MNRRSFLSRLFRFSKKIHKYFGLSFLIYFLWMGSSGVLLNHPSIIRKLAVPRSLLPEKYTFNDWNRMALRSAVFSELDADTVYVGGKTGVWISRNGGVTFSRLDEGFPNNSYDMDTLSLLLVENETGSRLLAGTRSGLYLCDPDKGKWREAGREIFHGEMIVRLLQAGDRTLAFTDSACYEAGVWHEEPLFRPVILGTAFGFNSRIPMFRFLLKLHDGSLFGLPGRLVVDAAGIVLVFLTVSAIYIWYVPWSRKKRFKFMRGTNSLFKFFYKYHNKIGIYAVFFLTLIALTGMFVRPPLLIAIASKSVPSSCYPASNLENPWKGKIKNAVYNSIDKTLIVATNDGFFQGPANFSMPFKKVKARVPVHGMGVTVFEHLNNDNSLLIGSFSGIYIWDKTGNRVFDVNGDPLRKSGRKFSTSGNMVSGIVIRRGVPLFWMDYRRGIMPFKAAGNLNFEMPSRIAVDGHMSLWHTLFELHNGRMFEPILEKYTWLIVPLGGFFLLITVLTGTYDWFYRKASSSRK